MSLNKKIEDITDIELAELMDNTWKQLVNLERQLRIIQEEISKRKEKTAKE